MDLEEKPGTLIFEFQGPRERHDWLVAELDGLGFTAFEDIPEGVRAYIAETDWQEDAQLESTLASVEMTLVGRRRIAAQNWNAQWEAGIVPVQAGPFYVHPPWHEPAKHGLSICIEPKMSFGTAHHETTRLILSMLPAVIGKGYAVLDAGTGTAVLAIAARLLGATSVVAFDIDPWSSENARENLDRNSVDGVEVRHGGIETAGDGPYDVILANINRGVLLEMMPRFSALLQEGGRAILSGILVQDRDLVLAALGAGGWSVREQREEGDWWAVMVGRLGGKSEQ